MARLVLVSDLITAIRQRADMERTNFVTDTEIVSMVNQSYSYLYDILVGSYENYFVAPPLEITIPSGTDAYALNQDFYKLLGVDTKTGVGTDDWVSLRRFEFSERNNYRNGLFANYPSNSANIRWSLWGNTLHLIPMPTQNYVMQVWYVPCAPLISAPTQTIDGVSGWEEYVINDCAIKCRIKAQLEVTDLMQLKGETLKRIEDLCQNRTPNEPARVTDVAVNYTKNPFYGTLY